MITYPFEFFAPRSVAEVTGLLAEHGEAARVMAGGMSLMPIMNLGLASPEVLVSLNHVDGLAYVRRDDGHLRIGAMTRHRTLLDAPEVANACPLLAEAAARVGDVQVRNRGTIGGSVAHADPAADYLPVLVAAGATAVSRGPNGQRELAVRDLLVGLMETRLEPAELLTELRVPRAERGTGSAYVRLARVEGSFAIANAAAVLAPSRATVVVGGVRPTPVVVTTADAADWRSEQALDRWAGEAVAAALEGGRGDVEARYREAMAQVCARRAAAAALRRAGTA